MFKLPKIVHSFLCWFVGFFIIFITHPVIILISLFIKSNRSMYRRGTWGWGKSILALANIKVKVDGLQNIQPEKNYLFVPNHQSLLDSMILAAALPQGFLFVMREDYFKIPLLGRYCKNAGDIPINIKDPLKLYKDLNTIIRQLKKGDSIVYFAQGRRENKVEGFKSGIAKIAIESQVPVIPIAVSGSAKLMPRSSFLLSPGTVKVSIGKPLHFSGNESYSEVVKKISASITQMLM